MSDNLYNLLQMGQNDNWAVNLRIARAFNFFLLDGDLSWTVDETQFNSRFTKELAQKLHKQQILGTQVIMRHFEDGPKYLTMRPREFEALEHTDLTLDVSDYSQPFPVVCFPIPEGYARDREITLFDKTRLPRYCIIWHRPDMIVITLVYSRELIWSSFILMDDEFEQHFTNLKISASVSLPEDELDTVKGICRACLNGALVFDQVKTTKFSTRSGRKPKVTDATYYSFDQSVKLYSREGGDCEETGEGSPVRPHWRRGHWRTQRHGVGLSLRKRLRIAPVLVRRDRFAGDLSNTKVTYDR